MLFLVWQCVDDHSRLHFEYMHNVIYMINFRLAILNNAHQECKSLHIQLHSFAIRAIEAFDQTPSRRLRSGGWLVRKKLYMKHAMHCSWYALNTKDVLYAA